VRSLPGVPQDKRRLLLFVFLHLARVEDKFSVGVSVNYVANLLDIKRTRQTMRMDWLFAMWWDYYLQHSHVLILKNYLVSFRRCFHAIQVSGPRAYLLGAIRCDFLLNLDQFGRQIIPVFIRMRAFPGVPQDKRRLLLFVFFKLAIVEENFPVSVSDDYVTNLLHIERTGPTMRVDWLLAVWWD
jgi:hypothetical protein